MSRLSRQGILTACLGSLLTCLLSVNVARAQDVDPEWPCVQRLVPDVSAAVLWPLPVEEDMHSQWKENAEIRPLAERLGDLPAYTETEQAAVKSFAESIPDDQKEAQLTLLAVGILDVTNGIRRHYISGIKRYTRQQIAIAGQIEETLNRISSLEGSSEDAQGVLTESAPETRDGEMLATLRWHERVYDQREHAIRSMCEQPVELEETLSDVLRDLAQYLP